MTDIRTINSPGQPLASGNNLTVEPLYPPLSDRIQSVFIDTLVLVGSMFAVSAILERMDAPPDWLKMTLFISIWLLYEPLATTLGGTLGNISKGIRVRSVLDPSKRIHFLQALLRYIIKASLGWLSFLSMIFTKNQRAIHDILSGSVMVRI